MVIFVLSEISEEASRRPLFRYSSTTTRSAYSAPFGIKMGLQRHTWRELYWTTKVNYSEAVFCSGAVPKPNKMERKRTI